MVFRLKLTQNGLISRTRLAASYLIANVAIQVDDILLFVIEPKDRALSEFLCEFKDIGLFDTRHQKTILFPVPTRRLSRHGQNLIGAALQTSQQVCIAAPIFDFAELL